MRRIGLSLSGLAVALILFAALAPIWWTTRWTQSDVGALGLYRIHSLSKGMLPGQGVAVSFYRKEHYDAFNTQRSSPSFAMLAVSALVAAAAAALFLVGAVVAAVAGGRVERGAEGGLHLLAPPRGQSRVPFFLAAAASLALVGLAAAVLLAQPGTLEIAARSSRHYWAVARLELTLGLGGPLAIAGGVLGLLGALLLAKRRGRSDR
jgi:hypothetical protein